MQLPSPAWWKTKHLEGELLVQTYYKTQILQRVLVPAPQHGTEQIMLFRADSKFHPHQGVENQELHGRTAHEGIQTCRLATVCA